jgi:hypothetical protein
MYDYSWIVSTKSVELLMFCIEFDDHADFNILKNIEAALWV